MVPGLELIHNRRMPDLDSLVKRTRKLASRYRIDDGASFRLKDFDPGDTGGLKAADKPKAEARLREDVEALADPAGHALRPGPAGRCC